MSLRDKTDSDEPLAKIRSASQAARRGVLRIFFGYAAGVGKSYAMLAAAHEAVRQGRDLVVGYVEPHARPDTMALLENLPSLSLREMTYRNITLREFNLDAALARRPEILLVDELAHTNAPESRHEKRWQDVEELLSAGISVWTTLNVQHIESLNDVIGQITGVIVRETIPDRVFELADELELIDITPDELLQRLSDGKVYLPDQAARALQQFFQKGNLAALRELSLRQTARRVHSDVQQERQRRSVSDPWPTADRLLVCVGPSPTTAKVIRTAKRMAAALDAQWTAVSVDVTGEPANSFRNQQIADHFRLAEQLGADTITLAGQDVARTILDFASARNVTKILIGKTSQPRWRRLLWGTVVDDLLERSGEIDVYVIHGEEELRARQAKSEPLKVLTWKPYLFAAASVVTAAGFASLLRWAQITESEANAAMMFLAAVVWTAFRFGRSPSMFASVLSVVVFDFFFVPPYLTFAVSDAQYIVTFLVMLIVGLVVSTLTSRLKSQVENTRLREHRTTLLYDLGKQLSSTSGQMFLTAAVGVRLRDLCQANVAIYLSTRRHEAEVVFGSDASLVEHPVSLATAIWVIDHSQLAGAGTDTLPNAPAVFLPVVGSHRTHGAIALQVDDPLRLLTPDSRRMLEACSNQLALALERDQLAIDAANARIAAEAEQVRSSLLSSVSHDLKTPLAAIAGASSTLLHADSMSSDVRRQLLETVADEAARLNRLLENILQMSKLDAGAATPNRQWHVLEEIIGTALHRTSGLLCRHEIVTRIPADLPLVHVDGLLLEQVFVNLFENEAKYTPAGSHVSVHAHRDGNLLRIVVSDNGPGIPVGAEDRIFEKFFRATPSDAGRGSGLGLAICRAIVTAHGGTIQASNRPTGGAEFTIVLPLSNDAPTVVVD